ncbi:MAG: hypothetical protein K9J37_10060 [Saprospiraceae bacterium]|nr:hypothetical protein [Saprospiraceae bacterium]MCF8250246.1 hypothetical protein [Saprospiraceae bacterium]MCF8280926.1 hypothetical protein [Bacteroidales bacterium]MCF8312122.1 hypothetical protein [Saprospiraceae bacterium]MCF8440529.1 hypothetical protein [Saprospiraceae bacterium]
MFYPPHFPCPAFQIPNNRPQFQITRNPHGGSGLGAAFVLLVATLKDRIVALKDLMKRLTTNASGISEDKNAWKPRLSLWTMASPRHL